MIVAWADRFQYNHRLRRGRYDDRRWTGDDRGRQWRNFEFMTRVVWE